MPRSCAFWSVGWACFVGVSKWKRLPTTALLFVCFCCLSSADLRPSPQTQSPVGDDPFGPFWIRPLRSSCAFGLDLVWSRSTLGVCHLGLRPLVLASPSVQLCLLPKSAAADSFRLELALRALCNSFGRIGVGVASKLCLLECWLGLLRRRFRSASRLSMIECPPLKCKQ